MVRLICFFLFGFLSSFSSAISQTHLNRLTCGLNQEASTMTWIGQICIGEIQPLNEKFVSIEIHYNHVNRIIHIYRMQNQQLYGLMENWSAPLVYASSTTTFLSKARIIQSADGRPQTIDGFLHLLYWPSNGTPLKFKASFIR